MLAAGPMMAREVTHCLFLAHKYTGPMRAFRSFMLSSPATACSRWPTKTRILFFSSDIILRAVETHQDLIFPSFNAF
jgi:hypothetical protein